MSANGTPVFLRNGEQAIITGRTRAANYVLIGRRANGVLELWEEDGAWLDAKVEHPFDIVSLVTPAGQLVQFQKASK